MIALMRMMMRYEDASLYDSYFPLVIVKSAPPPPLPSKRVLAGDVQHSGLKGGMLCYPGHAE
eukprot:4817436-Pyramimonas_sp.AAC.1